MKRLALFIIGFLLASTAFWMGGLDFTQRGGLLASWFLLSSIFATWFAMMPESLIEELSS